VLLFFLFPYKWDYCFIYVQLKLDFDLVDNYLYCILPYRIFSFYFSLNISEGGDSTASLGDLLHCLTILTVKR